MVYRQDTKWQGYQRAPWEELLQRGYKRLDGIAEAIEEETGATLEGRNALDYGCGVGRIAVPLAQRCEHVYALDLSRSVLAEAQANAERLGLSNFEMMTAERLPELAGRYDLVVSLHVLQHIPVREGERLFSALVEGLGPGGVGFINLILRPRRPVARVLRWTWRSTRDPKPRRRAHRLNPVNVVGVVDLSYAYMMRRSYSLNRLGRLLADAGVTRWHVHFNPGETGRAFDAAAIVFRKD